MAEFNDDSLRQILRTADTLIVVGKEYLSSDEVEAALLIALAKMHLQKGEEMGATEADVVSLAQLGREIIGEGYAHTIMSLYDGKLKDISQ